MKTSGSNQLRGTACSNHGIAESGRLEVTFVQVLARLLSRDIARDQRIQLFQKSAVALSRILRQRLAIVWQVVQESLDPLFIQLLPVSAIAGLLQPISIESLLELVAHGHSQVWLAQVERLGDQRESGVGDDGPGAGQIGEESVERGLLINDVPFFALPAEPVGNKSAADRTQQLCQVRRGRSHVDQDMVAL